MAVRSCLARTLVTGMALALGATGLTGCAGGNDVTRARLQASVAPTFANLYVQQAQLLGHHGVTVASTGASASCDKGGPKIPDIGPGANWICTITFRDQTGVVQVGRFEVNAHANSCFTVGGPSKVIGLATLADTRGNDVPNPLTEFDGCFSPSS